MASKSPSVDQLRRMAGLTNLWQMIVSAILPCIGYYFLYGKDSTLLGPQAWTVLALIVIVGIVGIMAHGVSTSGMIVFHLTLGVCVIPALGAWCTAWWFTMDSNCQLTQLAFDGCETCPCAATNNCNAVQLAATDCEGCSALSTEICDAFGESYNKYMLAFTGFAIIFSALLPLSLDIMVLILDGRQRSSTDARRQVLTIAVDQQTRLLIAGDKPTVTPNTLSDWVSALLLIGDNDANTVAQRCREALRERGYELPVRKPSKAFSITATPPHFGAKTNGGEQRGDSDNSGGGAGGDDNDQNAAERGEMSARVGSADAGKKSSKGRRPRRVTPEPSYQSGS